MADAVPKPQAVSPSVSSVALNLRHYRALLDTGADITCVCDHVVRECGLQPFGLVNMTSGNGNNLHVSHLIELGIWCEEHGDFEGAYEPTRSLFQLPEPLVAASIRDNGWFDLIIGTDIIFEHELKMLKGGKFEFKLG